MKDKEVIQSYINSFRKQLSKYLNSNVGVTCKIHQTVNDGAILEFRLALRGSNNDEYLSVKNSVNQALRGIDQNSFGGNLTGFAFKGTNVIVEKNKIINIITLLSICITFYFFYMRFSLFQSRFRERSCIISLVIL